MAVHNSEPKLPEETEIEWTPYAELHLLNALGGLKAIGVNHHFCMAVVWQRFTSAMHVNVSSQYLRKHLETFYDFANAEKLVGEVPFPNEEQEFRLPDEEFPGLRLEDADGGRRSQQNTTPVAARVREMILAKKVNFAMQSPLRKDERKKDEKVKKEEKRKFELPKEERKDIKKEMPKFFEKKLLKDRPIVKLTKSIIEETPVKRSPSSSKESEMRKEKEAAKKRSRTSESGKSSPVPAKRSRH